MKTLAALLVALPLAAAAQTAPPPEVPPAAPPAVSAQPAQPSPPPPYPPLYAPATPGRDTWYIGFGIGGGGGEVTSPTGHHKLSDVAPDPVTVFFNFKVGATLTPRLLLGLDVTAIRSEGDVPALGATVTHAVQISNYDAMLTWFPMERGPFLRGGVGLTRAVEEVGSSSADYNGVNLDVGVGYAFWLGRNFNLTVNLDYSAQSYSSSNGPSKSNFTALWLGFDWY